MYPDIKIDVALVIIITLMILFSVNYHTNRLDEDTSRWKVILGFTLLIVENFMGCFALIFLLPVGGWGEHVFNKIFGGKFSVIGSIIGTLVVFTIGYYIIFLVLGRFFFRLPDTLHRLFKNRMGKRAT